MRDLRYRVSLVMGTLLIMGVAQAAPAQVGANTAVLNPNLAGEEELLALPQLNQTSVEAIMAQRPFLSITELHELLGQTLSEDELAELYTGLFIPINLNEAPREEILLVPGVGQRMAREFLEYRPYSALAVFRREIGKYVSDEEVAAFEQYVFVPIDLNTASEEDILSIPGVGRRMLREFREYRPYQSIEQFRREMGKYVSEDEVARLERYVSVN